MALCAGTKVLRDEDTVASAGLAEDAVVSVMNTSSTFAVSYKTVGMLGSLTAEVPAGATVGYLKRLLHVRPLHALAAGARAAHPPRVRAGQARHRCGVRRGAVLRRQAGR